MIDLIIVLIYFICLLALGIVSKSKNKGFSGFSKIENSVNKGRFVLVATIFVSSIGGGTTFGISEKVFEGNIAYSYGLMLAVVSDILIAYFIIPKFKKFTKAETIGDIMSSFYGKSGKYISGVSAIMVSIGLIAAQISVSGRIFEYILQIDYVKGVILSYGIVVIYSTIGGFQSVLFANQLQFFAILFAIPLISIFGIYEIGFFNFIEQIPREKIDIINNTELLNSTISLALGFMVMNLFPTFIQRALINKNSKVTSTAIYIKTIIFIIFIIFITLNGLISYILYPDIKASLALPTLIDRIIPSGIQGLVIVGLLATVMSTADSDLNITSITLVKDFFKPFFKIKSEGKMLLIAKITNFTIGSLAIYIALIFDRVVDLVIFVTGFWSPVVIVPMIFGLFDKIITKNQYIISSFSGALGFLLWEYFKPDSCDLKGVFIGTMIHLFLFILFLITSTRHKNVSNF